MLDDASIRRPADRRLSRRQMLLTQDLVAKVHRVVPDPGPMSGVEYLDDAGYAAIVDQLLAQLPAGQPVWFFGYGSLLWRPACESTEQRSATVHGWHRTFALRLTRWRGTPDLPGLMLAIDRGGSCRGVAYRVPDGQERTALDKLLRREMSTRPSANVPRWVTARTAAGPLTALAFTMGKAFSAYERGLPEEEVVHRLAWACGHFGSCADYLMQTVAHLEELGIHDRYLWRLQALVAQRIREGRIDQDPDPIGDTLSDL